MERKILHEIVLKTIEYVENYDQLDTVVINGITWSTKNVGTQPGTFVSKCTEVGGKYDLKQASDACPPGFRIPTREEIEALCTAENKRIKYKGVEGRIFIDEETGGYLFFPNGGAELAVASNKRKIDPNWGSLLRSIRPVKITKAPPLPSKEEFDEICKTKESNESNESINLNDYNTGLWLGYSKDDIKGAGQTEFYAKIYYDAGLKAYENKDYRGAHKYFTCAGYLDPFQHQTHITLGENHMARGNNYVALINFNQALKLAVSDHEINAAIFKIREACSKLTPDDEKLYNV